MKKPKKTIPWHKLEFPKSVKTPHFVGIGFIQKQFALLAILLFLASCSPRDHGYSVYPLPPANYPRGIVKHRTVKIVTIAVFVVITPVVLAIDQDKPVF